MSFIKIRRNWVQVRDRVFPPAWHRAVKSEQNARQVAVSIASAVNYVVWAEPNRAKTPALHIGRSGDRYPTLTGLWWLDSQRMVVAHRNGLRVGGL